MAGDATTQAMTFVTPVVVSAGKASVKTLRSSLMVAAGVTPITSNAGCVTTIIDAVAVNDGIGRPQLDTRKGYKTSVPSNAHTSGRQR